MISTPADSKTATRWHRATQRTTTRKKRERNKTLKWTEIDPKIVLAAADICDGHTIFEPQAFLDVGVPQELVDRCTTTHESDFSNPKYTISGPDGKPVEQLRGIYGLDALASMVRDFDLKYEPKLGRGFQAEVWKDALRKHLQPALTST